MNLRKHGFCFVIFGMIGACGHGYEGEYKSTTESSNELLSTLSGSIAGQKYIIGSDFVESNGQRKLLDKIYVQETGGKEFLVFKDSASEEIWDIVDANTLRLEAGQMRITLTRIGSDQDQVKIQGQDDKAWVVGNWEIDLRETQDRWKSSEHPMDLRFQKDLPEYARVLNLRISEGTILVKSLEDSSSLSLNYVVRDEPFRLEVTNPEDFDASQIAFIRNKNYLVQKTAFREGGLTTELEFYWSKTL